MKKAMLLVISLLVAIWTSSATAEPKRTTGAIPAEETRRSAPAFIGDTISLQKVSSYIELTLNQVISGKEAETIVKDANFLNASVEKGKEYNLAYFHVTMQNKDENATFSIRAGDFDTISKTGQVYDNVFDHSIASLNDGAKIYAGGEADFIVPVYVDDQDIPLLLYNDLIWFMPDDMEGSRASEKAEREAYSPKIPADTYAITDYLYIGMNIAEAKKALKLLEDLEPSQDYGQGLLYSDVPFKPFGYNTTMLIVADANTDELKLAAFILSGYSTLASYNALSDYEGVKDYYTGSLGVKAENSEWWNKKGQEKSHSKKEGAASGQYNATSTWSRKDLLVSLGLNGMDNWTFLGENDPPMLSVLFCDPDFTSQIGQLQK